MYKKRNKLKIEFIGRRCLVDTGNVKDYYEATNFISAVENRQGLKIACLEEIAYKNKWITKKDIKNQ